MFVVVAKYTARVGEEDALLAVIKEMASSSTAEAGLHSYQAHSSPEDPRVFLLYEQYVDEAAYAAHMETEHFKRLILGDAIPNRIETRERSFYETVNLDR